MLDWLFIILMMLAILFVLITIRYDLGIYWNVILIIASIIIFFVLAASIHEIIIPWQMYNATSGNVETGYHEFHHPINTYLSYLFILFGAVMMIYFVGYILGPAIMKKWMR